MKQLKTNSDYAELFKGLMDLAGVNPHEFELFQKGMRNYPRPGDYQLKNKEFQTEPRWGEEWGIYFTPNKYINIDAMNGWKKDLTAEEVRVWAKMNGYRIPSEAELKLIVPVVSAVNSSLCAVNMHKHLLPQDLLKRCWSAEALKTARKDETRRLIVGGRPRKPAGSSVVSGQTETDVWNLRFYLKKKSPALCRALFLTV